MVMLSSSSMLCCSSSHDSPANELDDKLVDMSPAKDRGHILVLSLLLCILPHEDPAHHSSAHEEPVHQSSADERPVHQYAHEKTALQSLHEHLLFIRGHTLNLDSSTP